MQKPLPAHMFKVSSSFQARACIQPVILQAGAGPDSQRDAQVSEAARAADPRAARLGVAVAEEPSESAGLVWALMMSQIPQTLLPTKKGQRSRKGSTCRRMQVEKVYAQTMWPRGHMAC